MESLQDRSRSSSVTLGVSGGVGEGSFNGGANFNISKSRSDWVNEQTSLTAGGSVDIYVENKTTLAGAVIASDSGELRLDTGSFEYSHIKDREYSYNAGGGVNLGRRDDPKKENKTEKKTTYSVTGDYGFSDKRQINYATVGEGEIIVRDGTSIGSADTYEGLKRDVALAQYGTRDTGFEGGFTVDDTLVDTLTSPVDTYNKTKEQVLQGYEGYKETTLIIYSVGEGAVKAIMEDDLGFTGTIEAIGTSYRDVFTIIELTQDELLRNNIDGALGIDAATLEGSVNEVSMIVQAGDGADDISYVYLYQGNGTENDMMNYAAAYDQNTNSTYLNTLGTDISLGGDIITSLFTEAQRKYNHDTGITLTDAQQQNLAYFRGDQAGTLWNRFSDTASTESNRAGVYNWNVNNAGSSTLVYGTDRAANLVTGTGSGVVPRVYGAYTSIGGAGIIGAKHQSIVLFDDKTWDVYRVSSNVNPTFGYMISAGPGGFTATSETVQDFLKSEWVTLEGGYGFLGGEVGITNGRNGGVDILIGADISITNLLKLKGVGKWGGMVNIYSPGVNIGTEPVKLEKPSEVLRELHNIRDNKLVNEKAINQVIDHWENKRE